MDERQLRMQCLDLATRVGAFLQTKNPVGEAQEDCVARAQRYYDFVMGTAGSPVIGGKTLAEWVGVRGEGEAA